MGTVIALLLGQAVPFIHHTHPPPAYCLAKAGCHWQTKGHFHAFIGHPCHCWSLLRTWDGPLNRFRKAFRFGLGEALLMLDAQVMSTFNVV